MCARCPDGMPMPLSLTETCTWLPVLCAETVTSPPEGVYIKAYIFDRFYRVDKSRSEEHTSELQAHRDLHSFPTLRSSDLPRPVSGIYRRGRSGRKCAPDARTGCRCRYR